MEREPDMSAPPERPGVVVVGGGYGGINVAKALDEHANVVLVEPKDAFQHNIAALRALVDPDWAERIFLPYDQLLTHGTVLRDRAVRVDGERVVLASGTELTPDIVVLTTGSTYPFPAKTNRPDRAGAIAHYRAMHANLARAGRVMLLGAGAVGLELAGEIAVAWPDKHIILVDLAEHILPGPYDPRLRQELNRQLDTLGVERLLGSPLTHLPPAGPGELGPFTIATTAGTPIDAHIWFRCYGVAPVTEYLAGDLAGARTPDGYLQVTPQLNVPGFEHVYALGDIAAIDANMAGVARRQAEVVVTNIKAHLAGAGERVAYAPNPPGIILPLGPTGGAGQLPGRDDLLTAEYVAEIKGRDMLIDRYVQLLNAGTPAAHA
jgi:apoptosis-inducing factor 2